jgi:hypothetical protein
MEVELKVKQNKVNRRKEIRKAFYLDGPPSLLMVQLKSPQQGDVHVCFFTII